jgi:ssDNA-binding Zn-finger/Zn-ribbon topoisomerase 1
MKKIDPKKTVLLFVGVALLLAGSGWFLGCSQKPQGKPVVEKKIIYTCSMHHQIRKDQPGDCPICGMTLVPLEQIEGEGPEAGKAEGAPDALKGLAPIRLSAYQQHLIDVKVMTVKKAALTRTVQATGRFGGGAGDFSSMAGDFAGHRPMGSSGRYVVADVYALDIPYVRAGQKAWVRGLSGSGSPAEGKVASIYPFDQTQSRVTRVKIVLSQASPQEMFANVAIEATIPARLAVPPAAVMDTGVQRYVFVQTTPGTFSPRAVTTGFEGDDLWEITSGLKEGEGVAVGANFLIDADSKIKAAFAEDKK